MAMQEYESKIMQLIADAIADSSLSHDDMCLLLDSIKDECESRLETLES